MGNKPRTRSIGITAVLAAVTCVSGVAAAVSFDGTGRDVATGAASVSAGSLPEVTPGLAPLTDDGVTSPAPAAPPADAPTTAPVTVPVSVPAAPPSSTAASVATTAPTTTTTSTAAAAGEIYGFVTVNGIPAPGASMMLEGPGGERRTQTDLRGYYAFEHLAPGEYSVIQYSVFIPAPCPTVADACLGPATRMERHEVSLSPGESRQDDWTTSLTAT